MYLSFTVWPHGEGPGNKSLEIASSRMNATFGEKEIERGRSTQPKILCVHAKLLTENERKQRIITIIPNDEEKSEA